jgi:hypothetical protein
MALNPPILPSGLPAAVNGEYMVLRREDISAEVRLENGTKFKGDGVLYLTTARLVFVNKKHNAVMLAFDVPLALMSGEKFQQPIFGANYIEGHVRPLYNLIPCDGRFKFWFMSGGTGTFLPLFYDLAKQVRRSRNRGPDPRFVEAVSRGNLRNVAYVDPNDPTVIFVQQPPPAPQMTQQLNYYYPEAPQPSAPPAEPVYQGVPAQAQGYPPAYAPPAAPQQAGYAQPAGYNGPPVYQQPGVYQPPAAGYGYPPR